MELLPTARIGSSEMKLVEALYALRDEADRAKSGEQSPLSPDAAEWLLGELDKWFQAAAQTAANGATRTAPAHTMSRIEERRIATSVFPRGCKVRRVNGSVTTRGRTGVVVGYGFGFKGIRVRLDGNSYVRAYHCHEWERVDAARPTPR